MAALGIASSIYGGVKQNEAANRQAAASEQLGEYEAQIHEKNAFNAEQSAMDAISRGTINASRVQTGAAGVLGSQQVSYGAQGIDTGSATVGDVAADTVKQSQIDSETIRSNALKEAFGIRTQAQNERDAAGFSRQRGKLSAGAYRDSGTTSLITGGLQAVNFLTDKRLYE